jgi:molybdenum cofactor cytidylyltransferase
VQRFTTGLVLAAGGSSRLGRPKQLLDYQGRPLLDTTLDMARRCGFDQLIVALGGAGDDVRSAVDLSACDVVDNVHFTTGCSSSIVAALAAIDERAGALVLLLGDQPGVEPSSVDALRTTAESADASLAVCRYEDGRGHPFWFARSLFADLADLHGDKAVWKLLESGRYTVIETAIDGPVPIDVDTWADYERLLESS